MGYVNLGLALRIFIWLQVRYSPNANLYVSASKDGDIKVWDGVSNKCINTFSKAHDGEQVCSVEFSRNSKVKILGWFI